MVAVTPATDIAAAVGVLVPANRIVVLTGAGISTESGIPDFRGPDGIWTKNPEAEKYSTIDHYLADPDLRRRAWQHRAANPAWSAAPNAGHRALVDLEAAGRLALLVTQNIDGLHQRAGTSPNLVVEAHGTMREAMCVSCRRRSPMADVLERLKGGESDPPCERCGGILKSATVFFGEHLDPDDVERAFDGAGSADALVCVGTGLQVYPVAHMVPIALEAGVPVVILNGEPTPFDDVATVVRGPIGTSLPGVVAGVVAGPVGEHTELSDS